MTSKPSTTSADRRPSIFFGILAVLLLPSALAPNALASSIVQDQFFPGSSGWSQALPFLDRAQTFPVSVDGYLDRVDLYINKQSGQDGTMFWDIRETVNGRPIEADTQTLASGSILISDLPRYFDPNPVSLDLRSLNIAVDAGDLLAIVIQVDIDGAFWLSHSPANPGRKFERRSTGGWEAGTFFPDRAHAFATYVDTVPEPSALILAAGLSFLGCLARRKRE